MRSAFLLSFHSNMKSVLLSVQPKWCELIATGKKTIEVRKTAPKDGEPFKVYIYQTKRKWIYRLFEKLGLYQGTVIGEFVCDRIDEIKTCIEYYSDGYDLDDDTLTEICLTRYELMDYGKGATLFGWHISDLKIYDKPKEMGEFTKECKAKTCLGCKYRYNGDLYNPPECNVDGVIPIRPPQSWCYVEK